jgi:ATP-binding cassette, subfamily B, bacterial MsbA
MILPGYLDHARKLGYRRRWIAAILLIQIFAVFFEGIGLGTALPILQFIKSNGDTATLAASSSLWRWMLDAAKIIGISVNLVTLLCAAFLAVAMRQVFLYMRDVVTAGVQFELQRKVRNLSFDRFIHANLDYHDQVRGGDFVNELTTELQYAGSAMSAASYFIGYVMLAVAYLAVAALLAPTLTVIAIGVFAIAAACLLTLMQRMRQLGVHATRSNQDMSSFLVERLKSVRLVRLSAVEEAENALMASKTREQFDRNMDRRKAHGRLSVLVEPIVLALAFTLLYLSVTVFQLPIERIMVFFFILLRLVPIMKEAMLARQSYVSNLASIEVIEDRLQGLREARDAQGGVRKFDRLKRGLELRSVSFDYPSKAQTEERASALDRLSLTIPARRMTALVGPSGSGKSTLIDMLPRLRVPTSGEIFFDGVPQAEFSTTSLRRAISFAPQAPQLFNVTIAEHIRYGWPKASMDDVRQAARLAQAADFIESLPNGYETMLGEGGGHFSGGQRQRIDLARAVVRRAPILLLDEPTANLDSNAEAMFREALEKVRRETDITIIIIGHRLSTVMSADRIVVLDAGSVAEVGTHDELLAKGGWYARAFAQQHGRVTIAAAS